jgi:sensor histidine kinase YesM
VPALSLQPLLENAFVHAVEARRALTTLEVQVVRLADRLRLQVSDDGPGLRDVQRRPGGGVGLSNLRERLRTLYGTQASLQVTDRAAGGCVASLELPARG